MKQDINVVEPSLLKASDNNESTGSLNVPNINHLIEQPRRSNEDVIRAVEASWRTNKSLYMALKDA